MFDLYGSAGIDEDEFTSCMLVCGMEQHNVTTAVSQPAPRTLPHAAHSRRRAAIRAGPIAHTQSNALARDTPPHLSLSALRTHHHIATTQISLSLLIVVAALPCT
jgi:hypothetical protein